MNFVSLVLSILGLTIFEVVNSIDNAIINAEVLSTMGPKARKWFIVWGMLFAVFITRGLLPLLIVYFVVPQLGLLGTFTATFSSNPDVVHAIEDASPLLLMGGGVFLVFLFFHWLFLEEKHYGFRAEKFFVSQGVWFYAIVSILLAAIVWYSLQIEPYLAFSAVVGSTAFFITHGFKQQAEHAEKNLMKRGMSDISKILYLEVIDATFSIDGVLGSFAFTLSIPLILIGNGIGAFVLRELTVKNIDTIKKYRYLKNGAMYSILFLGTIMILDGFGANIPQWLTPIVTMSTVGYFFYKSRV